MVHRGHSIQNLDSEIAKCEVRCANCHRRITHLRRVSSEVEHLPEEQGVDSSKLSRGTNLEDGRAGNVLAC